MKTKNKLLSAMVLSLAVTGVSIPGVAHAAGGTWDYKGWDEGWGTTSMTTFSSQIIYSGGGDFMVKPVINRTGGYLTVDLYESDNGTTSGGTRIGTDTCNVGDPCVFDVRGQTDGDNAKAELYIRLRTSGSTEYVQVEYYD